MKNFAQSICTFFCLTPSLLLSDESEECSLKSPPPYRLEVKHIEANGVGYSEGYTTLEGFFDFPYTLNDSWIPFLDLRCHVFNDGEPAVNAGIGARYLTPSRVWGFNTYYDYRKTHKMHYNQIGLGFESLGEIWDYRINGYFPVGKTGSHLYDLRFEKFRDNSIIISRKKEIVMKGVNAEAGAHLLRKNDIKLYAAAGPYYFEQEGKSAWGGEGRLAMTLFEYGRVQLSASYDSVFHGILQGEAALTISFGGKRTRKLSSQTRASLCKRAVLEKRSVQRVDRNEIPVVTHTRKKSAAVDPVTGQPYTVWFVDNTSHSQGTYKSPFNTLLAAESVSLANDIIYVFKGDGTSTGMDSGLILKQGQQLLGAGTNQTIQTTNGMVMIPAQETGRPTISNAADATTLGVQLTAGNNVVSGFLLQDLLGSFNGTIYSAAISILNGSHYLIQNNQFTTFDVGSCINVYGPGDQTRIINNTFIATNGFNVTDGIFFWDTLAPVTGYFNMENNLFKGIDDDSGFNNSIGTFGPGQPLIPQSNVTWRVAYNTFVSQTNTAGTSGAIILTASNAIATIVGNYIDISDLVNAAGGVYVEQGNSHGLLTVNLDQNISYSTSPARGYRFVNNSGNPNALQITLSPSNVGTHVGP